MSSVLEATIDRVGLTPILGNRAQNRWRLAFATLYCARVLVSLAEDVVAKKQQAIRNAGYRSPSYTLINVSTDQFPGINFLREIVEMKDMNRLLRYGGIDEVVSALRSDCEKGVQADAEDLDDRRREFGRNTYRKPCATTISKLLMEATVDPIVLIVLLCATLSLGFGIKEHGMKGWFDGGSILVACLLVITVSAMTRSWPSRQFDKLFNAGVNIPVDVIRNGRRQQIPTCEVVVGDVVCLTTGDIVPANGLLIDGCSLNIDESSTTEETKLIEINSNNPFILSGTKVVSLAVDTKSRSGSTITGAHKIRADDYCRMLVTSVGMNTSRGNKMNTKSHVYNKRTHLQAELSDLSSCIAILGLMVAFLVFVILLIRYFSGNMYDDSRNKDFIAGKTSIHDVLKALVGILVTPAAIAATSIPDGLLLAFTITLAYSIKKMASDHALVQNLSACEAIGSATVICTNKKGILTLHDMKVTEYWLGKKYAEEAPSSLIDQNLLKLLHHGVGLNRDTTTLGFLFELSGNDAEEAIYNWFVKQIGGDEEELNDMYTVLHTEAFNLERKWSGARIRKEVDNTIHLHHKGAPEEILAMCSHCFGDTGTIREIKRPKRRKLRKLIRGMTTKGLKCIAFAHKQVSGEHNYDGYLCSKLEEKGLTLLAVVGLKYPGRPEVKRYVRDLQQARVDIKMITGDDVPAARASAIECGIIEPYMNTPTGEVIEGLEFRNCTHDERMEKADKIRVIARASTLDKRYMVQCLQRKGHTVLVTGHSIGDGVVLQEADIGLSLGIQGTDIAKENSDIIIVDDNFASVAKVINWGRSMYTNIQIFTQFQLTVSVASLVVDFVTAITAREPPTIKIVTAISAGEVPYAALQVLWVKLIVGALAALAIATENPPLELAQLPPVDRTKPFITNALCRNMVAQALYLIAVLLTILFKGESLFNINAKVKDTIIFNVLVLCQLFSIFSTRMFERNAFKGRQRNRLFWGIIGTILLLQVMILELLKDFAHTERLNMQQWAGCLAIAIVSWPLGWLVKGIPVPEKQFFQ